MTQDPDAAHWDGKKKPEPTVTIHGVKHTGQTPTPGRIVMFRHHDGKSHPAMVLNDSRYDDEDTYHRVTLKVFTPDRDFVEYGVPYHEGGAGFAYRTWFWPERVP